MSGTNNLAALAQQNAEANFAIRSQGLEMLQQIFTTTVVPASNPVLNIQPRNVGLLRGFWVEVNAKMYDADQAGAPTTYGAANLLSNIAFYDLSNNLRHNTQGWHVYMLDVVRKGYNFPLGFSVPTGSIIGGTGWSSNLYAAPTQLPASAPSDPNVRCLYYIPISYSKDDLRGSIYAGVVNATMNLQLTLNANGFSVANTGDPTLAVYQDATGSSTAVWSSATVTVYQDYIDQLPIGTNGAPILPITDLSIVYELKNTSLTGLTAGQDFPIPFSNFRSFLSTMMLFSNPTGTPVDPFRNGTDVNNLKLQAANFTNITNTDPYLWQMTFNDMVMADAPQGFYYMDNRRKPLNTNQYGNLELILNPKTVYAGATVLIGYEDMAVINTISLAGSLPGS